MKKIILQILACFGFAAVWLAPLAAQSYYTPGEPYVFRSSKANSSTLTSQLTVVYASDGSATITRQEVAQQSTDKESFWEMSPAGEITMSYPEQGTTSLEIEQDANQYWIVSFDNLSINARGANTIEVTCSCVIGTTNAKCSVSMIVSGNNSICASCVADVGCDRCKMETKKTGTSGLTIQGGTLLIKASSISIQ